MDLNYIFEETKKELKDDLCGEGLFKVVVESQIVLQTPALLDKTGTLYPKDYEIFEEAIYSFDGVQNAKVVFEYKGKEHTCLYYDESCPIKAIVRGVVLPEDFEKNLQQILKSCSEEELKEINLNKKEWQNYLDAKGVAKPEEVKKNILSNIEKMRQVQTNTSNKNNLF